MDYKKVLRLHFVNHLSCREIAESCGDCSKTTVNEFLKRFRENPELSYPLPVNNGELVPSARFNCTTLPKQEYRLAGWLYRSVAAPCRR